MFKQALAALFSTSLLFGATAAPAPGQHDPHRPDGRYQQHGGPFGHSLDDKFDPPLAAQNVKTLIDQGVLCLFLTRGTPHNQAILPLLAPAGIALIAPSTGAMVPHELVNP